jgi:hypothetical protein
MDPKQQSSKPQLAGAPAVKVKVAARSHAHIGHDVAGFRFAGRGAVSVAEVTPPQAEEIRAYAELNAQRFQLVEPAPPEAKLAEPLRITCVTAMATESHYQGGAFWPAGVAIFYELTEDQLREIEGEPGWEREEGVAPERRRKKRPDPRLVILSRSRDLVPESAISGAQYLAEMQARQADEAAELAIYEKVKHRLAEAEKARTRVTRADIGRH